MFIESSAVQVLGKDYLKQDNNLENNTQNWPWQANILSNCPYAISNKREVKFFNCTWFAFLVARTFILQYGYNDVDRSNISLSVTEGS